MKKRIFALVTVLVLCLSVLFVPAHAATAGGASKMLEQAKNSVVALWVLGYDASGRAQSVGTGSGFAVGIAGKDSDVFLTNWHVVTLDGEYPTERVRIWILKENCEIQSNGEPNPNNSIECRVMKTTSGYPDYAVIKMQKFVPGYKALPLLQAEKVSKGTAVYALGFPGIVEASSVERFGGANLTATDGIISRFGQLNWAGNTNTIFHTATISGGNSGGPLVTKDGAVIGINTYGFGEETTMDYSCAIYIDYAMEGLDALGIQYSLYSKDWMIGVCVAAAVLVIAVVAVVVYMRKKKADADEKERKRKEEEERRKKEEKERQEKLRLEDLSKKIKKMELASKFKLASAAGTTYNLSGTTTLVGRDPSCQICLPADAKGISRKHCQLVIQGNDLILTDLGSSYGTFIHEKRIPANTPIKLHSGSYFCLGGSNHNRFTVL